MNTAADLAADNIRLRRELAAAQTLAADYLSNAQKAAARAAEQIQTLRRALDTASQHSAENARLRGENTRLRAELERQTKPTEAYKDGALLTNNERRKRYRSATLAVVGAAGVHRDLAPHIDPLLAVADEEQRELRDHLETARGVARGQAEELARLRGQLERVREIMNENIGAHAWLLVHLIRQAIGGGTP